MKRLLAILLLISSLVSILASCGEEPEAGHVDYVSELKLEMNSETVRTEATIYMYIDGDTTHFNVPSSIVPGGILKARYISINTPESTGKIEPWGNEAAAFTKEKLMSAESIILESDNSTWNVDSTGERRVVWVWYKPEGAADTLWHPTLQTTATALSAWQLSHRRERRSSTFSATSLTPTSPTAIPRICLSALYVRT